MLLKAGEESDPAAVQQAREAREAREAPGDVPRVPFPDGVATFGGAAKGRSKIRPECLTIVQTSNRERGPCHFKCPYPLTAPW